MFDDNEIASKRERAKKFIVPLEITNDEDDSPPYPIYHGHDEIGWIDDYEFATDMIRACNEYPAALSEIERLRGELRVTEKALMAAEKDYLNETKLSQQQSTEIERLRKALEKYANEHNWNTNENDEDTWNIRGESGWDTAQAVLEQGGAG